jgi:hypothetical protein
MIGSITNHSLSGGSHITVPPISLKCIQQNEEQKGMHFCGSTYFISYTTWQIKMEICIMNQNWKLYKPIIIRNLYEAENGSLLKNESDIEFWSYENL